MKKILTVLFLLHFTLPSFSDEPGVISLMYHRVGEGKYPSTNVSTEMFQQHLDAIKASGLSYIEPEKFKNQILEGKTFSKRFILFTAPLTLVLRLKPFVIFQSKVKFATVLFRSS